MFNITLGQYYPGRSFLHQVDPRTKILATLVYSVFIFLVKEPEGFYLVAGFALLAMAASRIPPLTLIRGLRPILIFLVITLAFNAFMTPGETLWGWGPFRVTREGLAFGGLMALRLVLLVLVTSLLTLTTTPIALTDGLERLLRPFQRLGLPAAELALMMTIALRFVPTLFDEAQRILRAQQARGARLRVRGPLAQMQALLPILVPLFVAAFRRADELAVAMEARGYRGGRGRTRMRELRYTWRDGVTALAVAAFAAGVVYLRLLAG
ncbi:MAG: energy-coupling factor transporter transmembrane component T [Bacillota bacterium]|nr:MAG: transporter [Bacillota bacterium]